MGEDDDDDGLWALNSLALVHIFNSSFVRKVL
jgi:hypothetical protein